MIDKNRLYQKREALKKKIQEEERAESIKYNLKPLIDNDLKYQLHFDSAHYAWMKNNLPWTSHSLFRHTLDWNALGIHSQIQSSFIEDVEAQLKEALNAQLTPDEKVVIIYSNLHSPEIDVNASILIEHVNFLLDYPECWVINSKKTFVLECYERDDLIRWQRLY